MGSRPWGSGPARSWPLVRYLAARARALTHQPLVGGSHMESNGMNRSLDKALTYAGWGLVVFTMLYFAFRG